jgi:hypothetical protein
MENKAQISFAMQYIAFNVKRVLHFAKGPNTRQASMTDPLTHTTRSYKK